MSAPSPSISFVIFALALISAPLVHAQQAAPTAPAPSSSLTSPPEAAQKLIASAIQKMGADNVDGALSDLSQALKLNPSSTGAYVLRASIYCQRKQWPLAEADFNAAAKIAPNNTVLKFNQVEVHFLQKQYDQARPGFVALEKDPENGDLASYKVFLCDLFGGHEDVAKKELAAFTDSMDNASCEFSNAAWQLVHKNIEGPEGARYWLLRASHIYPPQKIALYAQSLHDLGYLPIANPVAPGEAPSGAASTQN